ncbi:hypothetical protein SAMN02745164_02172 [Marinitoga hydrogenitolerans DSM 16785]|uniref:Uncharacterized protein n=1 Tax=Marinitoga hydrogenitolerans (strain DSM 16785 / JCM 12826 / AT1271) TaxID=1122195 RepID=A0A1M5AF28_MARH1|nr:hypothetical protein [Marinitoga hydrogenitolerans]SHF28716.1 hypothetical protein SAMN02745164_02172 [Marinitoga hydrogenitolerans DSM 16785]
MIYRYIISAIIIIFSLFFIYHSPEKITKQISTPKFVVSNINENYTSSKITKDQLNEILSKLKAEKGVIIEELKIKNNYDFISNKNYSIYIKREIPENTKTMQDYEKYNYKVFNFLEIDMDKIWKNSGYLQTNFFQFSGVIVKNKQKRAYIYFKNNLKEIKEGMNLGDYHILKIYNDGVLLYNKHEKRFEVLR